LCELFGLFLPCCHVVLQELLAERARLQAEVEALKASAAAEANSSKAELAGQRTALADKEVVLVAETRPWRQVSSILGHRPPYKRLICRVCLGPHLSDSDEFRVLPLLTGLDLSLPCWCCLHRALTGHL